jgi:DNA-binding NarL/FixJ family response regulator
MKIQRSKVLIASENALLRECLKDWMERTNSFEVEGYVSRANELLTELKRHRPDVVLFDFDGLGSVPEGLLARLRARWPDLKVLVLAPRADEDAVTRALRYGAAGVLAKGEGLSRLLQALESVTAGQTWAGRQAIARALTGLQRRRTQAGPSLTPREQQLLTLLGDGYRNKELASLLQIKEQTVKIHLHSLFRKLNVRTRVEAALRASEAD